MQPSFETLKKISPHQITWDMFISSSLGSHAKAFIDAISDDATQNRYLPPLNAETFSELAQLLSEVDSDVTTSLVWKNYWSQPLIAQVIDPSIIKQHQKRILMGYRQRMMQMLMIATEDSFSGWEQKFEYLPRWDHFLQIQMVLDRYGQTSGYEKFQEDCEKNLQEKQQALLSLIQEKSNQHMQLVDFPLIQQHWKEIPYTSAYQELNPEIVAALLKPIRGKIAQFEGVLNNLDAAITKLCKGAVPGFVIQTEVKAVIDEFLENSHIKDISDVTFLSCIEYLNQPKTIAKIHEKIMQTRTNACLVYLEDTALLRQEIRKVTVYRVRRNLISCLYEKVIRDAFSEKKGVSSSVEICLMTLQEEYLHTIYRQAESLTIETIDNFLNSFVDDLVLQPLPPMRARGERNDFAKRELLQMRNNIELNSNVKTIQEEAPLHDIDSPIEMDILGEMCRQLMKYVDQELNDPQQMNVQLEKLSTSYLWIQSLDFNPFPPEQVAFKKGNFEAVKNSILKKYPTENNESEQRSENKTADNVGNMLKLNQKLDDLEKCFLMIQETQLLPASWLKRLFFSKANQVYNLNEWVKKEYQYTLKAIVEKTNRVSQQDKYKMYELYFKQRLKSPLALAIQETPQQSQMLLSILQLLYSRG